MHHDFIDRYSRTDSPVHRVSAPVKLCIALLIVFLSVLLPIKYPLYFIAAAVFLLTTAYLSKIPGLYILKRILLLEPIVLGVAVLTLLEPGGWAVFSTIVVKSTLCLTTMVLLSNTTPFAELLSLFRRAGLPSYMVTILALMYRYVYVLIDEAERMKRARASRTFKRAHNRIWNSLASLAAQLFVRSTERAERIYAAMRSRGWR